MDERQGTEVLGRIFEARGLDIQYDYPLDEPGMNVALDGFDPARRVGFEFITTEAGDRESFTPEVVARLEEAMARGELYVLLVDEVEAVTAEALEAGARGFLAHLERMGRLP